MRILQVHTEYRERGGEDSVVEQERQLLRQGGHDVEILEFRNPSNPVGASQALIRAPWNPNAARAVAHAAERFEADVVHVHNTWFSLSPAVFRHLAVSGFPSVATMHNYRMVCVNALLYRDDRVCEECVGRLPWRGVLHRCYRGSALQSAVVAVTIATQRAVDQPDAFVALTRFAVPYLESAGVTPERIVVKPNTVTDPGPRVGSPSQSDIVLYVGRLANEKGIGDLLTAWEEADVADLRLVVIGDGPMRQPVERRGAGLHNVDVVGPLAGGDVAATMLTARILVFPSRIFEGMPMVLLEAMAAGLGAIVPDHGPLAEIVGPAGRAYAAGSVSALASALRQVDEDPLADDLGGFGRRRYLEKFSPAVGLAALESVYRIAIERRSAR